MQITMVIILSLKMSPFELVGLVFEVALGMTLLLDIKV